MNKNNFTHGVIIGAVIILTMFSIAVSVYAIIKANTYEKTLQSLLKANSEMSVRLQNIEKLYTGGLERYMEEINREAKAQFDALIQQK